MEKEADSSSQIIRGSGFALVGQISSKLFRFFFNLVLTRLLPVSSYGIYVLVQSIYNILMQIGLFGTHNSIVHYISKSENNEFQQGLLKTICFSICLIASTILSIIIFFSSGSIAIIFNSANLKWILKLLAPVLPFYSIFTLVAYFFRAKNLIKDEILIKQVLFPLLLLLTTSLFLVFLEATIKTAVLALVTSILLSFVHSLKKIIEWNNFEVDFESISDKFRIVLKYSATVFPIGFSYIILNHLDKIMIGALAPETEVGYYNIASVYASSSIIFLTSLSAPFSPIISKLYSQGKKKELRKVYTDLTNLLIFLSFPIIGLLILFANQVLLLFGESFLIAQLCLVILLAGKTCSLAVGPAEYILTMTGYPKYELRNVLGMLTINTILNLLLIPYLGFVGGALATSLSIILINLFRAYEVCFIFQNPFKNIQYLMNILFLFTSFFLLYYLSQIEFSVKIALYLTMISLYTILYYSLLSNESQKKYLNKILKKFRILR